VSKNKKIPERILCQLSTVDIREIESMADAFGTNVYKDRKLDKKKTLALALAYGFSKAGVAIENLHCIKEIIFWEHHFEFRFKPGVDHSMVKGILDNKYFSDIILNSFANVLNRSIES
jgi:hypothetical protein